MQYRFTRNLGKVDVQFCNHNFGAGLSVEDCTKGQVVSLGDREAEWLAKNRAGLLEPVEAVKGVAKKAEITAPAKA